MQAIFFLELRSNETGMRKYTIFKMKKILGNIQIFVIINGKIEVYKLLILLKIIPLV